MTERNPLVSRGGRARRARRRPPAGTARPAAWRRALVVALSPAVALGLATTPVSAAPGQPGSPAKSAQPANQDSSETPDSDAASSGAVNVLVFHGPADEQDDPVGKATATIEQLGEQNGFSVDESTDPGVFTDEKLDRYRGVVFLSTEGVQLNRAQRTAFQDYIADGGGFLGVHDAARAQSDSEWFTDLVGTRPADSIKEPEKVVESSASAGNPPNEVKENLFDGDENTKWLAFEPTGWVTVKLAEPTVIDHYSLTSANDFSGRDPKDWTLRGSTDGQNWTELDSRSGQDFPSRFQTKRYNLDNEKAYQYYRLDITANSGDDLIQLADFGLYGVDSTPPEQTEPNVQEATVSFVDRKHPANQGLPLTWKHSDQWLNWAPNPLGEVHTVAQVKEKTYSPGKAANGAFHPVSWCRDYDGGRSFYTGMGATKASYGQDNFRSHLLGAIQWTTGMVRGDCQATIASNYKIERLTGKNKPGQLDQHGEMHGLTIAEDGTAFYIGKAACASGPRPSWDNPKVGLGCGTIHQRDPETGKVDLLTTLDVFGNRGSGSELVKTEEGLVGITLDPNFMENGWMYVYWMPHDSIDREKRVGKRTISRLTYDFENNSIDKSSRVDILQWQAQIHSCCHAGGGMDFDDKGNLYIAVGDNNSSRGSQGYSGNNWTKEYKGISFQDARRTSGNTNNLNGKILRIDPLPIPNGEQPELGVGSTYDIPKGNLFPPAEYSGEKTRPEIYVMGVRNPTRLHWDHKNDWLLTGWVGPDAFNPSPKLGPAKYDTATVITSAGNQGWPYCMGNSQPYRNRSNEDASVLTNWYDCDDLKNTSPRNTGLVDIPDARDNMIWYSPGGGGAVFPDREGSDIPTYKKEDANYTEPYVRGGCQAIMPGPTYRRSQVDTDSGVAWPSHWNNKWLIGDQCNSNNRIAVTLGEENVKQQSPPAFAESLREIIPVGGGDHTMQSWMGAKFGPDGALYMIDYGGGFFSLTDNQKLIRITYEGGPATPAPTASAKTVQGTPLTIQFTGERSGGVSYKWEFGDGATSTKANPRHTYAELGNYTAKLTVTYADGETVTKKVKVDVGCQVPDDRSTVWLRDADTGVANEEVGNGCTINDLIQDERDWSSHGAFVAHVNDVANELKKDGVLSGREKGKLSSAAAKSEIGKKGVTGYQQLFNGTRGSLEGWTQLGPGQFELRPDGSLRSSGGMGMLTYTAEKFGDFSLKLQFRDTAPEGHRANSGVFVRFPDLRTTPAEKRPECGTVGPASNSQVWVAIYCGQEVQIYDGESGDANKTGSIYNFDTLGLAQANPTPKKVWNTYEIRVEGQHYTIIRNGVVINEFDNTPGKESSRAGDPPTGLRQFSEGLIGLQNHSDVDRIEFRNIRIREL